MKHLQAKIDLLDRSIYAKKAYLHDQTQILKEKTQTPQFFGGILAAGFLFGFFLLKKRSFSFSLVKVLTGAFLKARSILHLLPM